MLATKFRLTKQDKFLIETRLIELELTKKELANRLYITNVTLSNILSGKKDFSKDFLRKLENNIGFTLKCEIDS